jgi:prepilin-type N-terminal cleavage/methylation domain-containing protein
MKTQSKKGFTLIELLIVIGILAVLATITVLVLNPAELFRQARDSQRISDVGSIKGALSLYLTTVATPDLAMVGACVDDPSPNFFATIGSATNHFATPSLSQFTYTAATNRQVDGNGWVPVNFGSISGGSPLSVLPIDPLNPNTAAQSYSYACKTGSLTFEIDANMESARYSQGGSDDVESNDGGDQNAGATAVYEVGTEPGLDL